MRNGRLLVGLIIAGTVLFQAYPAYAFEDASAMQYEIGDGVPQLEIDTISEGINRARTYIDAHLGGDAPLAYRQASIVKIVATGEGNQEPGGFGSCCTAFSVANPDAGRIFASG